MPTAARLAHSLPGDFPRAALVLPGRAAALGDGPHRAGELIPAQSGSGARAAALEAGFARAPGASGAEIAALVPAPPAPGASGAPS